jgi:hypothetical protein
MKQVIKNTGFNLIELIIATTLIIMIVSIGIKTFDFFRSSAKLAESREKFDTFLINTNTNALTGKSVSADYYKQKNSSLYHISRYLLFFKKGSSYLDTGKIIYYELQKDKKYNDYYKIMYLEEKNIPYPIFLQNISFANTTESSISKIEGKETNYLSIIFDPPFANINFINNKNLNVYNYLNEQLIKNENLNISNLRLGDLLNEYYLYLPKNILSKGNSEFALQYKNKNDSNNKYFLREYIEFDSNNQISHYWD